MFEKRAGELLVDLLSEWGVNQIYGMPGDSINQLMEHLRKKNDQINFMQVRHEEVGALTASAYAKLTGQLGVCLSIAGPGAVHLMNGLYDAKEDGAPVLVLAGQVQTDHIGTDNFQEIDLRRMFDDVSVYNKQIVSEEQLPAIVNQAIRTAYAKKGVAVITIPDDISGKKIKQEVQKNAALYSEPDLYPKKAYLEKAAHLLQKAEKPVILAGKGAKGAKKELRQFAETVAAPVVVSLPGKGVIPDDDPYCLGNLGMIGTKPAYEAMTETDLLIMVGTSFPYDEFLPDNAKAIQFDIETVNIGRRYPVDVGVAGDAKTSLRLLNENLMKTDNRDFLETYKDKMADWWEHVKQDEQEATTPIKPQQVIPALQEIVEDDAILSVDVGNTTVWMARHFRMSTNQEFLISSWLATMGCGLPGAIAGKVAYPDRQVVSVCGDGGFSMVMHDFLTAVKYNLPIVFVIMNNESIGMIKYEQQEMGNIEYRTDLQSFNFAKFAENCGGKGYRVEKHEELSSSLKAAASLKRPVIVDVCIEDQAPLPGKISYDQVTSYSKHTIKKLFEKGKLDLPPIKKGLKRL